MKTVLIIILFFISYISFSQNNYIVKTDDGRRVLLKADYTWEYIDAEVPATTGNEKAITKLNDSKGCHVADDFVEPELNGKIQSQLRKGRATIDDVKKKVAKDYNCEVDDVLLLSFKETKATGIYNFCANGKNVSYKRTGHTIIEKGKLF